MMLALAVQRGLIWLAVPLVIVAAHLMHGTLIGLHEAAHGLLRKNRRFNEFDGVVIGTLSLMSFSLYRVVHQTHHAHLSDGARLRILATLPGRLFRDGRGVWPHFAS